MVRNRQKSQSIEEKLEQFERQLRRELSLAASFGARTSSCGTEMTAPPELITIQPLQVPANDLAGVSGD